MCLAIPALVKSVTNREAEVEINNISYKASIWLTPEAKIGDYVLLHAGYAISILDVKEAQETLSMLRKMEVIK